MKLRRNWKKKETGELVHRKRNNLNDFGQRLTIKTSRTNVTRAFEADVINCQQVLLAVAELCRVNENLMRTGLFVPYIPTDKI